MDFLGEQEGLTFRLSAKRVVQGNSGTVHEWKKIEDHGNKNFVYLSHENKQISFKTAKSGMAKSRLHIANRIPKLFCKDDSNHSEDFCLKIQGELSGKITNIGK